MKLWIATNGAGWERGNDWQNKMPGETSGYGLRRCISTGERMKHCFWCHQRGRAERSQDKE